MILPTSGSGLPAWRQKVAPWLMAAVRLTIAWFLVRGQLNVLVVEPGLAATAAGAAERWAMAATLVAGGLLFAWPRTYLVGAVVLLAGLAWFEWLWVRMGLTRGDSMSYALALVGVLAAGEWAVRRMQRRLYAKRDASEG